MPIKRVGLNFDGSCVHITSGKFELPLISASYGDGLKAEWVYRLGSQVAEADTPGQYETEEGSLKLSTVNARAILIPNLAKFGGGNTRRNVIVTYDHPEIGSDSDQLIGFRFVGFKTSPEAASKGVEVEVKFRCRLIKWGNARMAIGNVGGTGAVGVARI